MYDISCKMNHQKISFHKKTPQRVRIFDKGVLSSIFSSAHFQSKMYMKMSDPVSISVAIK